MTSPDSLKLTKAQRAVMGLIADGKYVYGGCRGPGAFGSRTRVLRRLMDDGLINTAFQMQTYELTDAGRAAMAKEK